MGKREAASVAIKLMGVWILIKSVGYLPFSVGGAIGVGQTGAEGFWWAVLWYVLIAVVSLGWGLVIVLFSDKVAGWLIKEDKTIVGVCTINKSDVLTVGFTMMGLFLVVTDIPNLIFKVAEYYQIRSNYENTAPRGISETVHMFGPAIQIGLGVWLFAGSRGLVKLWERIRT